MNTIFFNSHTFLTKEVESALRKHPDLNVLTVNIPQHPSVSSIDSIIDQIQFFFPALIISINDAGLDYEGILQSVLINKGCYIVNWYHDYPFYEELFFGRKMNPCKERIDFVSEESFVPEMQNRSFNVFFLPLATDLHFFSDLPSTIKRDVSFVGNSSSYFIDSLVTEERGKEVQKLLPLMGMLKKKYYNDSTFNVRDFLINCKSEWQSRTNLPDEELLFILEWLCGYFYRRDFIKSIDNRYPSNFTCFGDADWKHFINPLHVSTAACYYTTLQDIYKSTKVNLNINRIQIRTSFTQRIFDCSACGAFILTDKRKLNDLLFTTSGTKKDLIQFSSLDECCTLIDYYLKHDDERMEIARRARETVLQNHTYDKRIAKIIELCRNTWEI